NSTTASTSDLPQKFLRASSVAMAMPKGSATTVETAATRSDSATAVHSWGVSSSTRLRHRLDQEAEAVFLEDCLGRRPTQKSEILRSRGALAGGRLRHGISDRRIRTVREYADDFHFRFDLGVGLIDDADRRLATR